MFIFTFILQEEEEEEDRPSKRRKGQRVNASDFIIHEVGYGLTSARWGFRAVWCMAGLHLIRETDYDLASWRGSWIKL